VPCSNLPLVRYSGPQRLDPSWRARRQRGGRSPIRIVVLDNAGWKRVDAPQAEFKRMAIPTA